MYKHTEQTTTNFEVVSQKIDCSKIRFFGYIDIQDIGKYNDGRNKDNDDITATYFVIIVIIVIVLLFSKFLCADGEYMFFLHLPWQH